MRCMEDSILILGKSIFHLLKGDECSVASLEAPAYGWGGVKHGTIGFFLKTDGIRHEPQSFVIPRGSMCINDSYMGA